MEAVLKIVSVLKEKHDYHFRADDIAWSMWATAIHTAKDENSKEELMKWPPSSCNNLFESIPTAAAARLQCINNGLVVAKNVSSGRRQDLNVLKEKYLVMKMAFDDFERTLKCTEERWDANDSILEAMDRAAAPEESIIAQQLAKSIDDMDDLDHLYMD